MSGSATNLESKVRGAPLLKLSWTAVLLLAAGVTAAGCLVAWALDGGPAVYYALGLLGVAVLGARLTLEMMSEAVPREASGAAGELSGRSQRRLDEALGAAVDVDALKPERVVALVGHSQSGKTEIAERLAASYPSQVAYASCGAFVRAIARERGDLTNKYQLDAFGDELVEELGPRRFIEEVLEHTHGDVNAPLLLLDDVYHQSVLEALSEHLPDTERVGVTRPGGSELTPYTVDTWADDGPLDRAVVELFKATPPTITIHGAIDDEEIARSVEELSGKLGLNPARANS